MLAHEYVSVLSAVACGLLAPLGTFMVCLVEEHVAGYGASLLTFVGFAWLAMTQEATFGEHRLFFLMVFVWLARRDDAVWPAWQTQREAHQLAVGLALLATSLAVALRPHGLLLFCFGALASLHYADGDAEEWQTTLHVALYAFVYQIGYVVHKLGNNAGGLPALETAWLLYARTPALWVLGIVAQLGVYVYLLLAQTKERRE
jgi:hypothetical protein